MKFSTREDIDAPIERVFEAVSDFDAFERRMLRRGVDITRDESTDLSEVGARWRAKFNWRGRLYDVNAELVSLERGESYAIMSKAGGIDCLSNVELVALSKNRTRLFVSLDLKPTNLSSRLMLQSLRLGKTRLSKRFKMRVHEFATGLSD